ncbi:alanine racemase [bacterium]|nr:alanine racemase [bacterium]
MSRPTYVSIDTDALLHNVARVKQCAPGKKIIAMIKANAYGCGLASVVPVLDGEVDAFGVACLEEAMAVRALGINRNCVLFQGVFSADELAYVARYSFQCVVHHEPQLQWILETPLDRKIKVWVKVNTGMQRLGFDCDDVMRVMTALLACPWVDDDISVMTHLASSDEPNHISNQHQLKKMDDLYLPHANITRSIANSAAILALPKAHADVVRPGIMLYGVSPFTNQCGRELGLLPVMRFMSTVTVIHHYPAYAPVGYGGIWQSDKPSIIGVVSVGYGDGYPRHIAENTPVWVNGYFAPIVGRVSMDMITIDLTHCPGVQLGDCVELWGDHIPVEDIARSAETIGYELICKVTSRVGVRVGVVDVVGPRPNLH